MVVSREPPKKVRRAVFGRDPRNYDTARLQYPSRVFEILTTRCGLRPGARVFEVGPGTGIATRELLRWGANSLTLIEADQRLVRFLRSSLDCGAANIRVLPATFERARLPAGTFDLGVAASSFHWIPLRTGLGKVARALRPGGWWVFWNNHHRDPYHPSPFYSALDRLHRERQGGKLSVWHGKGSDAELRRTDRKEGERTLSGLRSVRVFDRIHRENIHWEAVMGTERLVHLWASFSDTATWPRRKREEFLSSLRHLADEEFGGRVTIGMLTPVYSARRM